MPVRFTDTFSTAQALMIHGLVFFTITRPGLLSSSAGDYDEGLQRELSIWSFIRVSLTIRHTLHSPHIEGLAAAEFSAEWLECCKSVADGNGGLEQSSYAHNAPEGSWEHGQFYERQYLFTSKASHLC
ncbi:hypothetical protein ABG768_027674 [Culter alburnus]|uniref:Uncharacterized protein n=1 Tax=Culter alburnus TaxID=194366 RepID=A0AAW2A7U1_CULAL